MTQWKNNYELTQRFYFEAAHTLNRSYDAVGSKKFTDILTKQKSQSMEYLIQILE